jgi:hypothetical protein
MDKIIISVLITFGIVTFISSFFYFDTVRKYIKKRKGKLISTESIGYGKSKTIYIKYFDKNRNITTVSLNYFGPFPFFGEDTIVEYSTTSPEYLALQEKEMLEKLNFEKKANIAAFTDNITDKQLISLDIRDGGGSYGLDMAMQLKRPEVQNFKEVFLFTDTTLTNFEFRALSEDVSWRDFDAKPLSDINY